MRLLVYKFRLAIGLAWALVAPLAGLVLGPRYGEWLYAVADMRDDNPLPLLVLLLQGSLVVIGPIVALTFMEKKSDAD